MKVHANGHFCPCCYSQLKKKKSLHGLDVNANSIIFKLLLLASPWGWNSARAGQSQPKKMIVSYSAQIYIFCTSPTQNVLALLDVNQCCQMWPRPPRNVRTSISGLVCEVVVRCEVTQLSCFLQGSMHITVIYHVWDIVGYWWFKNVFKQAPSCFLTASPLEGFC